MKPFKSLFIIACAAVLMGCCYCKEYQRKYGRPLENTRWTLVQMDGRPVEGSYVLVFSPQGKMTVTGRDAVIEAAYKAHETGVLQLDGLTVTGAAAGDAPARRMREMLGVTTNYKMDGKFVMMIVDGEMWALFEARDPK